MDIRKTFLSVVAVLTLMAAPSVAMASPHHDGDRDGRSSYRRGERHEGRHEHDHYWRDGRGWRYRDGRDWRYRDSDYYYYRGGRHYHHYWDPFRLIWIDVECR